MPTDTQIRRMAEALIPNLEGEVRSLRSEGKSWRQIADAISARTDGVVVVTYETWRVWFRHVDGPEAAAS